jgi:hypothetical protein
MQKGVTITDEIVWSITGTSRGMDAVLHGYRGVQTRHEGHIQAGGVDK